MKPNSTQDDVVYDIQREIETWIANPGHSSRFGSLQVFVSQALSVELDEGSKRILLHALREIQDLLRGNKYELLPDIVEHVKSWKEDITRTPDANIILSNEKKVVNALSDIQAIIKDLK